ncbi:hypothetical protein ACIQPQ_31590 [Streptomyces sp. NPDC091281]|uniref:hypothetical protein n=1 Tax=Streptomyces sp. NPDC091281 TaxID=3365985 RepID=UPI00380BFA09
MSARDDLYLFAMVGKVHEDGNRAMAQRKLDAHAAEAIGHAIARLQAIPVDCTALTGPIWYGEGWKDCIRTLEDIADYRLPDGEAYPGELQRLRARVRDLRVAALRKEDLPRVQEILIAHAAYEATARDEAAGTEAVS